MTLAMLDLSLFNNGRHEDRQKFASQLLSGLSQQGFVRLIGHGVQAATVWKLFEWVGTQ